MKLGSTILLKVLPKKMQEKLVKRVSHILKQQKPTGYVSSLYGDEQRIRYKTDWMFPAMRTEFEDFKAPIPRASDEYLRYTYGDYMQLPPVEKRVVHHSYHYCDTENSYKKYKGIYYCAER